MMTIPIKRSKRRTERDRIPLSTDNGRPLAASGRQTKPAARLDACCRLVLAFGVLAIYSANNTNRSFATLTSGLDTRPLQFIASSGDIVRFEPSSVIVASPDRMLRVDLVGANSGTLETKAGAAQAGGIPGPPEQLTEVRYRGAWQGVTLAYESKPGSIFKTSYYIDASPAPNPTRQIRLHYNRPVSVDAQGNLLISYEYGAMIDAAPVAWQDIGGQRVSVPVSYKLLGNNDIGFDVGDYDCRRQLVIDPSLRWSTFLGGTGTSFGYAIAADSSGNVYVAGFCSSTWGNPVQAFSGSQDAFVAKLNSSGILVWNTFLGANGTNQGVGVAVDSNGNVYVTGTSTATWGSPIRAYSSGTDSFVAKLSSSGSLTWSTFLGGSGTDGVSNIAIDNSGNVYLAGYSTATWGSPVRSYGSGNDSFVAKLSSSGSVTWSTFLGGSGNDFGESLAVDGSGNVYVVGYSNATWGSPVLAYNSGSDGFVAKLNSSGSLTWNTFLGGSGTDEGFGIALDASSNVYLSGTSTATWGSPVRAYSSGTDSFAAKVNSSGTLLWNTFLGGSGTDTSYGIGVDGNGNVSVLGFSNATWGSPVQAYSSGTETFVAKLNNSGSLTWSTFLGGSGGDYGIAVAVDGSGNVYAAGYSTATWGSPVQAFSGAAEDTFVAKLNDGLVVFFKKREQDP